MTFTKSLFATAALAVSLLLPVQNFAFQAPAAAKDATKKAATKAPEKPAPNAADISAAQAKGMVWVNLNTKVYHKAGAYYGKTKNGQFMTEADAQKGGFKAAQESGAKKKAAARTAPAAPKK